MTYAQAQEYLAGLSKFGTKLGLETMINLCHALGNPQDSLQFIHIAGTNGKGSVLTYLTSILTESGINVGSYTSPAVRSRREQYQVKQEWIEEEELTELVVEIQQAICSMTSQGLDSPTLFEVETAMAFLYFKKKSCDVVVLETGMGGRTDATNVVYNTLVSIFTPIAMDHVQELGPTQKDIARVKAGIIKRNCRVIISATQSDEVSQVLAEEASLYNQPVVTIVPAFITIQEHQDGSSVFDYKRMNNLQIHMLGLHQVENACLAIEALEGLRHYVDCMDSCLENTFVNKITETTLREGLKKAQMFGRMSVIHQHPTVILDGAHNIHAIHMLCENLKTYYNRRRIIAVTGVFKDKEYHKMIELMSPLLSHVISVTLPNINRSLPASVLHEAWLHADVVMLDATQEESVGLEQDQVQTDRVESINHELQAHVVMHDEAQEESVEFRQEQVNTDRVESKKHGLQSTCFEYYDSIDEGMQQAFNVAGQDDVVLVFGSLSLLCEAETCVLDYQKVNHRIG